MEFIKNTKHRDIPHTEDGKLLKDLDMKILASDPRTYTQYAHNIRKEWSAFNDEKYREGRLAFLHGQLQKTIFLTLTNLEDQANQNISNEINSLQQSS